MPKPGPATRPAQGHFSQKMRTLPWVTRVDPEPQNRIFQMCVPLRTRKLGVRVQVDIPLPWVPVVGFPHRTT